MTHPPPDLDERITLVDTLLASFCKDVVNAIHDISDPDFTPDPAVKKTLSELRYWVKQAFELQKDLQAGALANDTAITPDDLDQIRHEIECRLSRLRECCSPDGALE